MAELLEIYDLQSNLVWIQERKSFYKEIREEYQVNNQITRKVRTIKLLLMNSAGRIYLQKRSRIKEENTGMYDKTVGGHIVAGDSANMTVVKECAEEMWFPAVVASEQEFLTSIKVIDFDVIGLFRQIDYLQNFISVREMKKDIYMIKQPQIITVYCGYYDGAIKFKDGEASGIEVFSLGELKEELEKYPEKFTEDLKFMIEKYEKYLVPVSELIKTG